MSLNLHRRTLLWRAHERPPMNAMRFGQLDSTMNPDTNLKCKWPFKTEKRFIVPDR